MPSLRRFLPFVAVVLAACGSVESGDDPVFPGDPGGLDAPPVTKDRAEAAAAGAAANEAAARTDPDVLAWVNGEPVNRRDVLVRVGPQLATVGSDEDRARVEATAVIEIMHERILDRAARNAGIDVTRDALDRERTRRIQELEKNGGRFDAYLRERQMTAREYDDQVARKLRMSRYLRAAVGLGADAQVRVRAITDTFVTPHDVRAFYDRNPSKFDVPELGRCRVLMVRADVASGNREAALSAARSRAQRAVDRLRAGEDWSPVFRETVGAGTEPDPSDGLQEITRDSETQAWIREFAFREPKGKVLGPEQKGNTFFVLRAEGWAAAHRRTFEESHDEIQGYLGNLRQAIASYEVALSLLEEAAVSPRERYDSLREFLAGARKRLLVDLGL